MATNTPFFQAFGALLFGRRPRKMIGKVKALGSLGELYELFGDLLPDHLLARSDSGPNSRERTLTPKVTFWAFVSQVFEVGSACRDGSPISDPRYSPPPPRSCARWRPGGAGCKERVPRASPR